MADLLDILSHAGRSARDLAMIKAGLLRQAAAQNAAPMARGLEEGLIGEGVDMARAGVGALGDAYGAGDGALEKLLSGYRDRMAKARARAAALRAQSPEAFEYGEKLPERLADAAGLIGVAGHARMPEFPRIGPGAAPEMAFARAGGEASAMRMPETGPKPISRAGELLELEQRAYHGTHVPNIEKFDIKKIGSGEGNQSFGWGGYFAENAKVAKNYQREIAKQHGAWEYDGIPIEEAIKNAPDALRSVLETIRDSSADTPKKAFEDAYAFFSERPDLWMDELGAMESMSHKSFRPPKGYMYETDVPENDKLLDWDSHFDYQPNSVQSALRRMGVDESWGHGDEIYRRLTESTGSQMNASGALEAEGVPGLRYLDEFSRSKPGAEQTRNFVIWDQGEIGPMKMIESKTKASVKNMPSASSTPSNAWDWPGMAREHGLDWGRMPELERVSLRDRIASGLKEELAQDAPKDRKRVWAEFNQAFHEANQPPAMDLSSRIAEAMGEPHKRVTLADIRARLSDVDRAELDQALVQMMRDEKLALFPEDNRRAITPEIEQGALDLSGVPQHLAYLRK